MCSDAVARRLKVRRGSSELLQMMSTKQIDEIAVAVRGVPVRGCLPGSTAAEAGIRYGDIVLAVNGFPTPGLYEYMSARKLRSDGCELKLFRDGQELSLFVPFRAPMDAFAVLAAQVDKAAHVVPEADLPSVKTSAN
jgi:S1-C subfamily serine protease